MDVKATAAAATLLLVPFFVRFSNLQLVEVCRNLLVYYLISLLFYAPRLRKNKKPAFSHVFVLGGPGAGKGTQACIKNILIDAVCS